MNINYIYKIEIYLYYIYLINLIKFNQFLIINLDYVKY